MKRKIYIIATLLLTIIGVIGGSYAYLKAEQVSKNPPNITLANLDVELITDMSAITMDALYPMDDSTGLNNEKTTFQIQNNSTILASYMVSLIDKEGVVSTLKNEDVRYQLTRTNETTKEKVTLDIKNLASNGLIDEGTIEAGVIYTYELVMWMDIDSTANGTSFSKVLLVEGMQVSNLDQSGANFPELLSNMIPVYYDKTSDTEGVWRVADSTNLNETYQWFDYNNYMWANAVTVHKDVMNDYYGYSGPDTITTKGLKTNIETYEEKEVVNNLSDITFASSNQDKHSTSSILKLAFTTTSTGTLSFNYIVGSETNYDKLTVTISDGSTTTTLVNAKSGSISSTAVSTELVANTNYTLTAKYSKDSSTSRNGDTATIKNLNITSTLSGEIVKDETVSYPWSGILKEVLPTQKQLAASSYTYNEETGIFTLSNPTLTIYTQSSTGMFTCNSDIKTSCSQLYEIKTIDSNNVVTSVDVHRGSEMGEFGSQIGQEVKMDDITTMWVWIPRYKYTMFTGLNEPSEEQLIEVTFEHGIDKTGTITCQDNILTASDSASSETCTDSTYGTIIKGKSTYTHPAFTFGEEELTGFWMAKFEMSTDDTTCINSKSSTNCNKTDLNILVKPSVDALNYQTISTEFASIRRMEIYGNIHGFSQSENATSHLDSNSYLTGEILNDSNNFDTHMLKNMEWGAVAYLSQSRYGKWSNSLYSGDYRRVYKNNYYTSSNYVYKTGYSGGNYNSSFSVTNTYLYNDMIVTNDGQGYRGAGASTTGTVYGVYDMNGGLNDYVMANHVSASGRFFPSRAGGWVADSDKPMAKYYDKYSFNNSYNSVSSQTRGKLGDATKEVTTTFDSSTGGWGGVSRYMTSNDSSWFHRGSHANSSNSGVFYSYSSYGAVNYNYGTRPVLAVSRDFPWLSE